MKSWPDFLFLPLKPRRLCDACVFCPSRSPLTSLLSKITGCGPQRPVPLWAGGSLASLGTWYQPRPAKVWPLPLAAVGNWGPCCLGTPDNISPEGRSLCCPPSQPSSCAPRTPRMISSTFQLQGGLRVRTQGRPGPGKPIEGWISTRPRF